MCFVVGWGIAAALYQEIGAISGTGFSLALIRYPERALARPFGLQMQHGGCSVGPRSPYQQRASESKMGPPTEELFPTRTPLARPFEWRHGKVIWALQLPRYAQIRGKFERHRDQVRSGITLRDTWSRYQAGAMRPVRRAGWVCVCVCGLKAVLQQHEAAWAGCTCAGAAHMHFSLVLCCGDFLVPVSPA